MKIHVIIGATREPRVTERVAKWAFAAAAAQPDFEVELVDLATFDLPFFAEAGSPRFNPNRQLQPNVKPWLDKLAEADGYIVVSPEYDRSMPGVLKNAFEFVDFQLDHKPVALVTHGSTGGALAAESLRQALRAKSVANVAEAVTFIGASEALDEAGNLSDEAAARPYGPKFVLDSLVASLAWWTRTLKAGRDQA